MTGRLKKAIGAAAVASSVFGPTTLGADEPTLPELLRNAARYVSEFESRFSLLVAEERYEQTASRMQVPLTIGGAPGSRGGLAGGVPLPRREDDTRVLKSDFLLVQLPDGGGWMPYRDVFEVNGRKVRDREDRLLKLVLDRTDSSSARAARIMRESTRYNLGRVTRTINIPTLGLLLLRSDIAPRLLIVHSGDETIGDRKAWVLTFVETARPTLIRTTNDLDMPQTGRFWVDPETGVVLKTAMVAADTHLRAEVRVTFREDPVLHIWTPAQMDERYSQTGTTDLIQCTATYSNYRRFQVATDEQIDKPKEAKPPAKPPPV